VRTNCGYAADNSGKAVVQKGECTDCDDLCEAGEYHDVCMSPHHFNPKKVEPIGPHKKGQKAKDCKKCCDLPDVHKCSAGQAAT